MQGLGVDGFLQEYIVAKYRNAVVLPKDIDLKAAAPLFCAGVTSYNAVSSCELEKGDWLAIVGCGGLGHLGQYTFS